MPKKVFIYLFTLSILAIYLVFSQNTTVKAAPAPLPPTAAGFSCSVDPTTISGSNIAHFKASGLNKNLIYKITINSQTAANPDLARVLPDSQGEILVIINPKDLKIGVENVDIGLQENGRGIPKCSARLTVPDALATLRSSTFYTCDKEARACKVAPPDYTGAPNPISGNNPNKQECDVACAFNGESFLASSNISLCQFSCPDGSTPKTSKNGAPSCPSVKDAEGNDVPQIPGNTCADPKQSKYETWDTTTGDYQCICTEKKLPDRSFLNSAGIACDPEKGGIIKTDQLTPSGSFIVKPGLNTVNSEGAKKIEGIMTAIGCVPTKPQAFVEGVLRFISLGVGAIALLLMVLGAIKMITSDGSAEAIQAGKDQFVAALLGLLFVIFSVLLLQVIGVDILGLPGFTR